MTMISVNSVLVRFSSKCDEFSCDADLVPC